MQNVNCHVTIQAPKDKTISLSFPTVYFKQSVCDVIGAGITVHDGADQSAPIKAKICSATQGVYSVRSTSDTLYVRFRTGQIPMAFQGVYEFSKYMYLDIVNVFLFVTLFQVCDLKISNTFFNTICKSCSQWQISATTNFLERCDIYFQTCVWMSIIFFDFPF